MSAFTDRLYRAWSLQNGYIGPRFRGQRGIGGVPLMVTQHRPVSPAPSRTGLPRANDAASRPDKPVIAPTAAPFFTH